MSTFSNDAKQSPAAASVSSPRTTWITDGAWLCGVVGAVAVLTCAYRYYRSEALNRGVYFAGIVISHDRIHTVLLALFVITATMVVVELIRLWLWDELHFISIDPQLREKKYASFFANALSNWFFNLGMLWLVRFFYHTAGEYAFAREAPYYQPWFECIEMFWHAYLWAGLPYVLITRALKHDLDADRRDLGCLLFKVVQALGSALPSFKKYRPQFDAYDKKTARALLVKVFFTPLMTVFFCDQFPHLISNIGYMLDGLPNAIANHSYTHQTFNKDFFNISIALIFSIDVAVAWAGYVISSRWVDNQTISAEPTMLGWVVCLICYPPFQMFLGLYYGAPGEREVLQFTNQWMITLFTAMMTASYFVYMTATLCFGVRFSNLTHRGIIRTGPFAWIRHPAYASKNFAWWCVMFPAIVWNASHTGVKMAALQLAGLVLMTWVYYLRALTEERHLGADPTYVEYCREVPYRFIPGVL